MDQLYPELERVLITEEAIRGRVGQLAAQIGRDYAGAEPLYLIGILKGAFIFMADLSRELSRAGVDHVVDFMAVSSYGRRGSRSGEVRLVMDLRESILDRHVLLVEDIVDTGRTLNYLLHTLQGRGPASLKSCVLVRKPRSGNLVPVDYLGFDIPDNWVVGYGLDYADRLRTLPYIAELKPDLYR